MPAINLQALESAQALMTRVAKIDVLQVRAARWDGCMLHAKLMGSAQRRIEEGHLMADHVHMMIAIPPKYAVCNVVGYIKGKSEIHLARMYGERKRNFAGQSFWARGYFVSTVGRDEAVIRNYIQNQEEEDERLEQLGLWR